MVEIPKFKTPARAFEFAEKYGKLDEHGEKLISQDAEYSFAYAKIVIKERFELGENAISQNAYWSYWYALDVIKGKLPEDMHNKMIMLAIIEEDGYLGSHRSYARKYLKDWQQNYD
jgi:hypothetical protein